MSKKIKNKGRFFFSLILLGLLLYLVGYGVYDRFFKEELIYQPTYGVVPLEVKTDALLVRNEILVYAQYGGEIVYNAIEGEKIKRNALVAKVQVSDEAAVEGGATLQRSMENYLLDTEKNLDEQWEAAVEALRVSVTSGTYGAVPEQKEEIARLLDRKRRLAVAESDGSTAVTEAVTGLIENNVVGLRSPAAGILSYAYDGYEMILQPEKLARVDLGAIFSEQIDPEELKKNRINTEEPVFKVIDSAVYHFLIAVDPAESHRYELKKDVSIDVEGQTVAGRIEDYFVQGEKLMVLIRSDEQFNHFHKRRQVPIRLKIEDFQGLTLHADSLFQREGSLGVYRIDQDQRARFTPVKVLGSTGDQVVVKDGSFIVFENEEAKTVKTIDLFDRVLREAERFEEGDKIQ